MGNVTSGAAAEVIVGPARILVAPTGTALPVFTANPVVWDDAWKESGYTDAGVELQYKPTFKDIEVDEEMAPVKKVLTKEDATITTSLAQATLDNLATAISASKLEKTSASGSAVGISEFNVGSGAPQECMVAMEGLSPNGFWRVIIGYRAMAQSAVKMAFKRTDKTSINFELGLLADSTKDAGERLLKIVDMTAAKTA